MSPFIVALLIFCLRIVDVSLGTVRVIYSVRGNRFVAATLGIIESGVWIFAISKAFKYVDHPVSMVGWALGFGAGTLLGISIERWIASGFVLMRAISVDKAAQLREALADIGFGVTAIAGEGRTGAVQVVFVVAPRRRGKELIRLVQRIDPDPFVTLESTSPPMGGHIPAVAGPSAVRK